MPKGLKIILRTLEVIFDGLEFVVYAIMFVFSIFGL
jgi:hypothetical protein